MAALLSIEGQIIRSPELRKPECELPKLSPLRRAFRLTHEKKPETDPETSKLNPFIISYFGTKQSNLVPAVLLKKMVALLPTDDRTSLKI